MIRYSMNDSLVENNPWPTATSRRLNWTAILPDEPNRAKGNWTWTLPRPPCKFAAVPTVLVTPSDRLSPRLAWSRKSTSLASLLPRSSASAYGGSVDFRSHCKIEAGLIPASKWATYCPRRFVLTVLEWSSRFNLTLVSGTKEGAFL